MIGFILLFIGLLAAFGYVYARRKSDQRATFDNPNKYPVHSIEDKYRQEIYDFTHQYDKQMVKHRKGCGCRLCYKYPLNFRDLKEYNWWDFHDTSGQRVYAGGTLPLFGLWTNKENLRAPHCLKAKFNWRFNSPCTNPAKGTSPDYPFPAQCNNYGRCRIRGPLEDHIKNL